MPRTSRADEYDVHPGVQMMVNWIANLKSTSGRTLDQWIRLIRASGPKSEPAARDWLKREHGHGTNAAWWLAERAFARPGTLFDDTPEDYLTCARKYVEDMYAGPKATLRPIHDAILRIGRSLGPDVNVCPCKTMVPLFRQHVFAQVKPGTRTRLDLGLCLTPLVKAGRKMPPRLEDTGGFRKKDRITHRIPLTGVDQIDDEVRTWLKTAYELDA